MQQSESFAGAVRLVFSLLSCRFENAYETGFKVLVARELPAPGTQQQRPASVENRVFFIRQLTIFLSIFCHCYLSGSRTLALGNLQSQPAEAWAAALEVTAIQTLTAEVRKLKHLSTTGSAPPRKLPKLSRPGQAVQQEFNAGIHQSLDDAVSTLPRGNGRSCQVSKRGQVRLTF